MVTIDVSVFDVDKGDVAVLHNRRQITLVFLLEQKLHETLDHVHFDITAVIARYQHFSFRVQNKNCRHRHFLNFFRDSNQQKSIFPLKKNA